MLTSIILGKDLSLFSENTLVWNDGQAALNIYLTIEKIYLIKFGLVEVWDISHQAHIFFPDVLPHHSTPKILDQSFLFHIPALGQVYPKIKIKQEESLYILTRILNNRFWLQTAVTAVSL